MCGLIGIVRLGNTLNSSYKTWFKHAIIADTLRGFDSTGIAAIKDKETFYLYKKAMPGFDFVQMPKTNAIIEQLNNCKVLMGHNRAATRGSVTMANAHPFQAGHIVLAHNGTLVGNLSFLNSKHIVDSAQIADAFSQKEDGDIIPILERLDGAYALTWFDTKHYTFSLARNDERPLYYSFSKDKDVMLYASEDWMITGLSSRLAPKLELDDPEEVPSGELWRWDLENKKANEVEKTKFKVYKAPAYTANHQQTYHNNTYNGYKSGIYNQIGIFENDIIPVELLEFTHYHNDTVRGTIRGVPYLLPLEEFGVQTIIYAQQKDLFDRYKDTVVQVKITDARWDHSTGKKIIVLTATSPAPAPPILLENWESCVEHDLPFVDEIPLQSEGNASKNDGGGPGAVTSGFPRKDSASSRWCAGPKGLMIPLHTFISLTSGGCNICKEVLSSLDADKMSWTPDAKPICPKCTGVKALTH